MSVDVVNVETECDAVAVAEARPPADSESSHTDSCIKQCSVVNDATVFDCSQRYLGQHCMTRLIDDEQAQSYIRSISDQAEP